VSFTISDEGRLEAARLLSLYPDPKGAILPILRLVQKEAGHIPQDAIPWVAGQVGASPAEIEGVATFYSMYERLPVGKHRLQICRNLSCSLMGAEKLIDHVCARLGIRPGETTADGMFTLSLVECLGSCGTAPVMQVDDDYHENLTVETVDALLDRLRSEG
jgi:NADH-quinone oxidoreductase subunit E